MTIRRSILLITLIALAGCGARAYRPRGVGTSPSAAPPAAPVDGVGTSPS